MPNSFFSRQLKTVTLKIDTNQNLIGFEIVGDRFTGRYSEERVPSDGPPLPANQFTVDRSIDAAKDEILDFNGTKVSLADLLAMAAGFVEMWRQEDDDQRAADALREAAAAAAPAADAPAPIVP